MRQGNRHIRADHADAKKIEWRIKMLEQFPRLKKEQMMMPRPEKVVRVRYETTEKEK